MNFKTAGFVTILTVTAILLFNFFAFTNLPENKSNAVQQNVRSFPGMVYFEM